ncbi:MAG: energy transducer TonB [Ignavibacteriaceae bacterium]|nr:energy transducer TonB [Ignavibacteriaceae bacterium]
MKLLAVKNFSSILSILFHIILFVIIIFFFNQKAPETKVKVVEIGFGGTSESNSSGGPGGGNGEEETPLKPIKEVTKVTEKNKVKTNEETISDKNKNTKKITQSASTGDTSKGHLSGKAASGGTGTGSGSGTGTGTGSGIGGSGNGQGSGPAKKGLYIPNDIYYVAVDQMPVPVGGSGSIAAKAVYPAQAKANNIHGTVYVLAFIDERGYVKKLSLIKGIGGGCDQSAMQAVKSTRFEPGILHGMTVKVQLTVPVTFGR